jgi:hypothetical protein
MLLSLLLLLLQIFIYFQVECDMKSERTEVKSNNVTGGDMEEIVTDCLAPWVIKNRVHLYLYNYGL